MANCFPKFCRMIYMNFTEMLSIFLSSGVFHNNIWTKCLDCYRRSFLRATLSSGRLKRQAQEIFSPVFFTDHQLPQGA
jgi:hypothetical protein